MVIRGFCREIPCAIALRLRQNSNQARDAHWSLALEPITGLAVQPERPVTIQPRGLSVWRIYEADAKPPRSCLFVRAVHRGRDGQLELYFCGGAEDMPGMSVPLAAKWIEPLTVRVQSQALDCVALLRDYRPPSSPRIKCRQLCNVNKPCWLKCSHPRD